MTDLDATLAAIDDLAVQQCGHCARPLLEDGQSLDFCNDYCQQAWIAARNEIVELIGYSEPFDLAAHYSNQVELYSPEVTPRWTLPTLPNIPRIQLPSLDFNIVVETTQILAEMANIRTQLAEFAWAGERLRGLGAIFDEVEHYSLPADAAPESDESEPFDPDYEYDWRPVPALHEDPPLPTIVQHGHDWQAIANANQRHVQAFAHTEQRPRSASRRRS